MRAVMGRRGRADGEAQDAGGDKRVLRANRVGYASGVEDGEIEAILDMGGVSIKSGETGGDVEASAVARAAASEIRGDGGAGRVELGGVAELGDPILFGLYGGAEVGGDDEVGRRVEVGGDEVGRQGKGGELGLEGGEAGDG